MKEALHRRAQRAEAALLHLVREAMSDCIGRPDDDPLVRAVSKARVVLAQVNADPDEVSPVSATNGGCEP